MDMDTRIQMWEQDEQTAEAWGEVWRYVRATRIGGAGKEWADSEDAFLLAIEFAEEVLGEEDTEECEELTEMCLDAIRYLL